MSRIRRFCAWRLRQVLRNSGSPIPENQIENILDENKDVFALNLACAKLKAALDPYSFRAPPHFLCDEGLGGLARWLRAAGYKADWRPGLDDAAVIRAAREEGAILVTSDTLMMERGVLRDGIVPAVWVPSPLKTEQQLTLVLAELNLPLLPARCMNCGGELILRPKAALQHRIPPKTFRWVNEYFTCLDCDQLFWKGTHWQKISSRLASLQHP